MSYRSSVTPGDGDRSDPDVTGVFPIKHPYHFFPDLTKALEPSQRVGLIHPQFVA
jgi:hypothetical protein